MRRWLPGIGVILLAPLLLGAADPAGDLAACSADAVPVADAPIDVVRATGSTAEDGLAMRFTVTFAAPLPVPDDHGHPLRVDVLLRDPNVPDVSVEYYRHVNRIVRFDDVGEGAGITILLLPERSDSPFTEGTEVDGETLTITIPSRMVMPDPDLEGFDYSGLRWTVVARDGGTCDVLGERAVPTRRLKVERSTSTGEPSATGEAAEAGGDPLVTGGLLVASSLAILAGGAIGFAAARWRRRAG